MNVSSFSVRSMLHGLIAAVLLPCACLLGFSIYQKYQQDEQAAATESYNLARLTAENVQVFLADAQQVLVTLAQRPQMQSPGCDPIFQDLKDFFPRFSNISRSSLDGYLVCSGREQKDGRPTFVGDMAWFKQVVQTQRFVVGPIVYGPINKGWIMVLAQPVFNAAGVMTGAVQTPIDLVKFNLAPKSSMLPNATLVSIIDGQGNVISRSSEADKFVGQNVRDVGMITKVLSNSRGILQSKDAEGIERIFGFVPIAGTDWKVLAGTQTNVALQKAMRSATTNIAAGIVILCAAIFLGVYFSRRISRPILDVREAAGKVASGDLSYRTKVGGPSEIVEVATRFNQMLDAIVVSQRELRESETRLQLAMDGSRLALWEADMEAGTLSFTDTWAELIGGPVGPSVYTFDDFYSRIPAEDFVKVKQHLTETLKGLNENFVVEYRFPIASGELTWFSGEGRVSERDEHGKALCMIGVNRDIRERKAAQQTIQKMAFYDALTGLPNRRFLMEKLQQATAASRRYHHQNALLFIDLDNFKLINDSLGHTQGDILLQQAGERIASCLRETDVLARLGGDEFVVLLENLDRDATRAATHAEIVGEKIRAVLNQPTQLNNGEYQVSASIGIALLDAQAEVTTEALLQQADTAMFQAKAGGRNMIRFFDPEMSNMLQARTKLETEMRAAISQQQFELYYQPQVDRFGQLTGAEALVRWIHPERGMVSPAEFIPLAEETGLILRLGLWVMEEACRQLARWSAISGMEELSLAVNVSARQFRQKSFVGDVLGVLARSGARASQLKLELTEGLLLENIEETIEKMTALQQSGVAFSLDDFGTGYSSLSYLKRLPLNQLKIDQSFVRDILVDPNDAAIAKMVITLAGTLGLQVIAEGVETREQRDFLATQGCNHYQGYLFGRPLPCAQFEQLEFARPEREI